MAAPTEPNEHQDNGWLHRIIMLSDGVFAIAITLLALELRPPENWDGTFASLFRHMWAMLAAYLLSFTIIAIYWAAHRRSFARFLRADGTLTILNFIFLGLVVLLPPVSNIVWHGGRHSDGFMIYWVLICLIGLSSGAIWGYAAFIGRLMDPATPFRLRLWVMVMQAAVPPLMAGMSLYAVVSGQYWIYLTLPIVGLAIGLLRRRLQNG